MKLRIRGDSVRFRLQRAEVAALLERGHVEEHVRLGMGADDRITYRVETGEDAKAVSARWSGGCLTVVLPTARARAWGTSDAIALEDRQPVGDAGSLKILVEKDLACIRPRTGEDDRDAYPNPADHC